MLQRKKRLSVVLNSRKNMIFVYEKDWKKHIE